MLIRIKYFKLLNLNHHLTLQKRCEYIFYNSKYVQPGIFKSNSK